MKALEGSTLERLRFLRVAGDVRLIWLVIIQAVIYKLALFFRFVLLICVLLCYHCCPIHGRDLETIHLWTAGMSSSLQLLQLSAIPQQAYLLKLFELSSCWARS